MKPHPPYAYGAGTWSPPSRRRGLKRSKESTGGQRALSPPSRRRGLKQYNARIKNPRFTSPPSRRRGLKRTICRYNALIPDVASLAEAWIETVIVQPFHHDLLNVASLAEAWIETTQPCSQTTASPSPPSRRRGLKHPVICKDTLAVLSPPSRRRGLKLCTHLPSCFCFGRLPRGGVD